MKKLLTFFLTALLAFGVLIVARTIAFAWLIIAGTRLIATLLAFGILVIAGTGLIAALLLARLIAALLLTGLRIAASIIIRCTRAIRTLRRRALQRCAKAFWTEATLILAVVAIEGRPVVGSSYRAACGADTWTG